MDTYFVIANIAGGIVNVFLLWKQGGQKATRDLIDLQEKQIETLKTDIELVRQRGHDRDQTIQSLTLQVGVLQGESKEKDKKLEEYLSIIQNRNPELEQTMKSIEQFMRMINEKLDVNQQRNTDIDANTRKDEGHLMRKK